MKQIKTNDGVIHINWAYGNAGPTIGFHTANSKGTVIHVCAKTQNGRTYTAKGYVAEWFPEGVTKKIAELMELPFEELWEMAGGPKP